MKRISGWLSARGRLFVAVPNARAASRQIAVNMGLISHHSAVTAAEAAHGHRVTYSMDTLSRELNEAGLRRVTDGGVFFKGLANFQLDRALEATSSRSRIWTRVSNWGAPTPTSVRASTRSPSAVETRSPRDGRRIERRPFFAIGNRPLVGRIDGRMLNMRALPGFSNVSE
ncbi:MAG: hypothetical protein WDN30_15075 [Pararobbsia sp.]